MLWCLSLPVTLALPHLRRGALAVGVVEDHVLGARQLRCRVHGWRHVEQRQLQVRGRRRRLLRIVLRRRQWLRVAAAANRNVSQI